MSLLRTKELEAQMARRNERIQTLELELNTATGANIMLRRELTDEVARRDARIAELEQFDLIKAIQDAINSVVVPRDITPQRAEYFKAGCRATISKVNGSLAKFQKGIDQ